ncbi:hypothetical protein C482_00315 [Natrialba chahannaoensis JCM 10990]|uniref:Uncharacterized protein n=1 Tax=Natrialba chahannaoensis JCM 10990 TaxID=1227492 RepID=M0B983_9EURY|nr:hypothetical protein [Natrialba chahannaoensis]ELZ06219.1 hypothetical protein C482_00315 [Natrialba chahannaoensis JCM 10990]
MSAPTRLPQTTARAIAVIAAGGTAALASVEPAVAVAALCGLALSGTVVRFEGAHRQITLAAALVPALALVTTAVVVQPGTRAAVALTVIGVFLGAGVGGTLFGSSSTVARDRVAVAMVLAAALTAIAALAVFAIQSIGSWQGVLESLLWQTGDGVGGLFIAFVVTALAGVAAVAALPDAVFTTARRRDEATAIRYALTSSIGVLLVATLVGGTALVVIGWYLPPVGWLVERVLASDLVRGVLFALTLVGVTIAALGGVVRRFWDQTTGASETSAIVPVVVGTTVGTGLTVLLAGGVGIRLGSTAVETVGALFAVTMIVLAIVSVIVWHAGALGNGSLSKSPYVVATTLAAGGLILGVLAEQELTGTGLAAVRAGLPTFVVIGAALLCYDLGRHGRSLAREIGPIGASPTPQLVRIGWSGAVASGGVVAAVCGFWLATMFQPTLSVPATVGVVVGFGVLVVGARVLLR